ncbi:MAG: N-6 DNA methylase [Chromatiales bacterium]|nr:N-6 DNA methylase [Chromatiales bacterium]
MVFCSIGDNTRPLTIRTESDSSRGNLPASTKDPTQETFEPYLVKIYDLCCGSGGMLMQLVRSVESHEGNKKDISIHCPEQNVTTW